MHSEPAPDGGTNSKVAQVIDEYGLDGFGEELERRWTAEDGDSLRDLAALFNRRVLGAAIASTPGSDGRDVESTYETLTDDDVSAGERRTVRRNLERDGLDVDALTDDFVSHQAIHTYLTGHRGATYPDRTPEDRVGSVEESINRLRSRTAAVTKSNVERLATAGEVTAGSVEVFVSVDVFCEDCGSSQSVGEFLETGGCRCVE
jgi:predicted transcriptional regulator